VKLYIFFRSVRVPLAFLHSDSWLSLSPTPEYIYVILSATTIFEDFKQRERVFYQVLF